MRKQKFVLKNFKFNLKYLDEDQKEFEKIIRNIIHLINTVKNIKQSIVKIKEENNHIKQYYEHEEKIAAKKMIEKIHTQIVHEILNNEDIILGRYEIERYKREFEILGKGESENWGIIDEIFHQINGIYDKIDEIYEDLNSLYGKEKQELASIPA